MDEQQAKPKWRLSYGIHRHTLMSRDAGGMSEYDTEAKLMEAYRETGKWLESIGYVYWYADKIAPDGTKTRLEQNPYW